MKRRSLFKRFLWLRGVRVLFVSAVLFVYTVCIYEVVSRNRTVLNPETIREVDLQQQLQREPRDLLSPFNVTLETTSTERVTTTLFSQLDIPHLDVLVGELDSSSRYRSHTFFIISSLWAELSTRKLTLATQTSIEHLYWLTEALQSWTGPVSVAVFTPDIEYHLTIIYITYLRHCFEAVREQVTFHFLYPLERPPQIIEDLPLEDNEMPPFNCSENPKYFLKTNLLIYRTEAMMEEWREQLLYPQNILRNLARKTCNTEYVLCADVDMIPTSTKMVDDLGDFLIEVNCTKCAYVVPVYEISTSVSSVPHNKTELIKMIFRKQARPFHKVVFEKNQLLSDLKKWQKMKESEVMEIAYKVKEYDFFYEPIYISDQSVPPYDERFLGYGNTRNTQVYEMFLCNWTFNVLNNAFLIHWGFQNKSTYPTWRKKQIDANRERFRTYVREMAARYDKDPIRLLKRYPKNNTNIIVVPKGSSEQKTKVALSENQRKKISMFQRKKNRMKKLKDNLSKKDEKISVQKQIEQIKETTGKVSEKGSRKDVTKSKEGNKIKIPKKEQKQ